MQPETHTTHAYAAGEQGQPVARVTLTLPASRVSQWLGYECSDGGRNNFLGFRLAGGHLRPSDRARRLPVTVKPSY